MTKKGNLTASNIMEYSYQECKINSLRLSLISAYCRFKKKTHHNVIHVECRLLEVQELFSQNRSFRVHIVWITLPHLALILWQRSSAGQATSWIESIIFLMKLCCYCQLHTVYSDGMAMQCHWKDEWNCNNITVLSTPKLSTFRSMIVLKVFIHFNHACHQ